MYFSFKRFWVTQIECYELSDFRVVNNVWLALLLVVSVYKYKIDHLNF